jgi:ligand-binding sensor domain-containing protein/signal transduction histidine kinase
LKKIRGYRSFKLLLLFVLTISITSGILSSQNIDPNNLIFKYLTLENGLPNNKANAVTMDKYGFMWFGTNDGVCRFDGLALKYYPLDHLSGNFARTSQISVMKTMADGNLLIGSYSLFRYDYSTDRIFKCDSSISAEITGRVYAIEQAPDGEIWIGSEKGLFSYKSDSDKLTSYSSEKGTNYLIISILIDNGKLWLGTRRNGLLQYDIKNGIYGTIAGFTLSTEVKDMVNCLYKDKNNVIWAGTQDNGIYKFDTRNSSLSHVFPDPNNSISYRIRKIINDKYGNLWIGSRLGIFFQAAGTDKLTLLNQVEPLPSKSRSNSIYDIYIDQNDIMWIGTFSFGISYTDLKRKPFFLYNAFEQENTLAPKMINCFNGSDSDKIWIGTEENGLFRFNRLENNFTQYKPDGKSKKSASGENVKALAEDSKGNLWIGYYSSGLDYFETEKGIFTNFKNENTISGSISSNAVRSLALDSDENLWIATDKGVDQLKKGSLTFKHFNLKIEVLTISVDSKKQVWAGTSGDGIYRLDTLTEEFKKVYAEYFTTSIKAIHIDVRQNIWVGTNKGLYFINTATDSVSYTGTNRYLPSNAILDILEDNSYNLWVSTGGGLVKCEGAVNNPLDFTVRKFSVNDGLQGEHFREFAAYRTKSGEFFMGGVQGFNIFTPDSIRSNPFPPKLAFTNLKIYNNNVEIGEKIRGKTVLEKSLNETELLTLSYLHTPFSIEFVALHYSNPPNNSYRYRLEPLEKEWNNTSGIRNFASYSNLGGGEYTLIVEASNNDGLWNRKPITLKIKVIPPVWKTWWFSAIMIIVISIIALRIYRNRISRLQRYNYELGQKVEDRTRLLKESLDEVTEKQCLIEKQALVLQNQKEQLQELNSTKDRFFSILAHDLKNPFQTLLGMSEILAEELKDSNEEELKIAVNHIQEASNNLYSLVGNLLTWSLSQTNRISFVPEKTDISMIISSIIALLKPDSDNKNISVITEFKTTRQVFADKNMIEMVVRNLITNAIKFTPSNGFINIVISETGNMIQLEIHDNGVGISPEHQEKLFTLDSNITQKGTNGEKGTGLGLIICKEFVEKNNGKIWIISKPDSGSSFFITIPGAE